MKRDIENIAKEILTEDKNNKINSNLEKFSKIFSTPQGKALIETLAKDNGKALGKALEDARVGNIESAKKMISSVASTKEGAEILQQIIAIAE